MPRKKKPAKRIQVSVSPEFYDVIKRTSDISGDSMSSIVANYLEACYHPMRRMLVLLEAAQDAPEQIKQGLRDAFDTVENEAKYLAGISEREADRMYDQIEKGVIDAQNDPLNSNRGVTFTNPLKNKESEKSENEDKK